MSIQTFANSKTKEVRCMRVVGWVPIHKEYTCPMLVHGVFIVFVVAVIYTTLMLMDKRRDQIEWMKNPVEHDTINSCWVLVREMWWIVNDVTGIRVTHGCLCSVCVMPFVLCHFPSNFKRMCCCEPNYFHHICVAFQL